MPLPLWENPASVVDVFQSFIPGYRLVDGGELLIQANLLFSVRAGIVGGTTQQTAHPLETFMNQVASGQTVELPPGVPGRYLMIVNDSGGVVQVYGVQYNPATRLADSIAPSNSSVTSVMVTQNPGEMDGYFCYEPGIWKQVSGLGVAAPPGGGIPDAPINGLVYGRENGAWVQIIGTAGGTMTGNLYLSPTQDTTNPNSPVSIGYIQNIFLDEGTY